MPYKLRKAPNKDLYWVTEIGTNKKFSKLPISLDKAKAQLRILDESLKGGIEFDIKPPSYYMMDDAAKKQYDMEQRHKEIVKENKRKEEERWRLYEEDEKRKVQMRRQQLINDGYTEKDLRRIGYGKLKGGITDKKYTNYLQHLRSILKNLGSKWETSSFGKIKFGDNYMGPVMALIQAYFSPSEFEQINNSQLKKNLMRLLEVRHINEFIKLVRELYPKKFEGPIRVYINNIESGKLNHEQEVYEANELIRLILFTLLKELAEDYVQDPVDLSKYRTEFRASGKHKNSLKAVFDQVKRGATPEQEHQLAQIYNQAIQELGQAGKTRSFLGMLRGKPVNQAVNERKLNIVRNATSRMHNTVVRGLSFWNPMYIPPGPIANVGPDQDSEGSDTSSEHIIGPVRSPSGSMSSHSTDDPGPDSGAMGNNVFPNLVAAGKRKKRGGMTPEQRAKLEHDAKKLLGQINNHMGLSNYYVAANKSLQAGIDEDEIFDNDPKYIGNNLKSLKHLIAALVDIPKRNDMLLSLGKIDLEQYEEEAQRIQIELEDARDAYRQLGGQGKPKKKGGMIRAKFQMNQLALPPRQQNQPQPPQRKPPPPSQREQKANQLIGNEDCVVCNEPLVPPFKITQNVHTGKCGHRCHINPCYNNLPGVAEDRMNPNIIGTKVCPACQFIGYGKLNKSKPKKKKCKCKH